jgi:glucosamine 6-phosphate synthetase-like amidotransferase/phosphosugar isomerase protein
LRRLWKSRWRRIARRCAPTFYVSHLFLRRLLDRADEFLAIGAEWLRPEIGGRVYAVGCGDGLFASRSVESIAASLGLDWRAIGALSFLLLADRLTLADRVIVVSMSGNVDRTIEAAMGAKKRGNGVVVLCNGAGGRLADFADTRISIDVKDIAPFLSGTTSYTASILALFLMAVGAAGQSIPREAILATIGLHEVAFYTADPIITELLNRGCPTGVRFLSAGTDAGTADYAAAKLVELGDTPAWSAELEEFAHSQFWSMPVTDLVVLLAGNTRLAHYANHTACALSGMGVRILAIGCFNDAVQGATSRIVISEPLNEYLSALVLAAPVQLLAYEMAERTGFDPNRRLHLKKDEMRFRTSRLLTRRSLVGMDL